MTGERQPREPTDNDFRLLDQHREPIDGLNLVNSSQALNCLEKNQQAKMLDQEEEEDEDELLSEALLAVASAEEYAAKIIKLQQACLTPLKEDLADWLNKIMNVSTITTENFMDKLDNGVIVCRLAKVISKWCQQRLNQRTNNFQNQAHNIPQTAQNKTVMNPLKIETTTNGTLYINQRQTRHQNLLGKLSTSTSNVSNPSFSVSFTRVINYSSISTHHLLCDLCQRP